MLLVLLTLCRPGEAAALDTLDVGGPWGSPTTDEPTALWWNPAGIAAGGGHQLFVEGAPVFASFHLDRAQPHRGVDEYGLTGVIPYLGLTSDLGVDGLGLGLGLAAPYVRGAKARGEGGAGSFALREGSTQTLHLLFAGAYEYRDLVAVGAAFHLVDSRWEATLDNDTMVQLSDALQAEGEEPGYTDEGLEDPRYATTLDYDTLHARTHTWALGLRARPHPRVVIGLSHQRPYRLDHQGEVSLQTSCPPTSDAPGRLGAELYGICDSTLRANAGLAYDMPARWHMGVAYTPIDPLRVELLGGFVTWSRFSDYEIQISGTAEKNTFETDKAKEETPALIDQDRLWARDAMDSWFAGLDLKQEVAGGRVILGGRALYDRAAIPTYALSANNWDADDLALSALVAFRPLPQVRIGATFTHHILAARETTDSEFGMTLDPATRKEDRWFYPHGNGRYTGGIERIGLSGSLHF